MQVTRIEPVRGRRMRYRIYLNDEPAFLLYSSDLSDLGLSEGCEADAALLEKIYSAVLSPRAALRCMHILKTADKTEWQLRTKLRQDEYPKRVIDAAIEYVKSYHYVDDERYAANYIESCREKKSRREMIAGLKSRGVPDDVISRAFEQAEPVDSEAQIRRWMEKRHFDPETASYEEQKKFINFLQRKGFSYTEIKKALT